ncbi:hypothetical protein ONZ45_g15864 [Pleurotus djamor]|nr:hypothetical protein ONZ45_g15864 [Pleurotus djamor]
MNNSLEISWPVFGRPLVALIVSSSLDGAELNEINWFPPWYTSITKASENDLVKMTSLLRKLKHIQKQSFLLRLLEDNDSKQFSNLRATTKWITALRDLLSVSACRTKSIDIRVEGTLPSASTESYLLPLIRPWYKTMMPPSHSPLLETLDLSCPDFFLRIPALPLYTTSSITSLKLKSPNGVLPASLDSFHLPNLQHFELKRYSLHPTSSIHSFLSLHTQLRSVHLELMLFPSMRDSWPGNAGTMVSSQMLPNLEALSADFATLLWTLNDPSACPSLQHVELLDGSVGVWLEVNPLVLGQFWDCLTSTRSSALTTLGLCDGKFVSRSLGIQHAESLPKRPLVNIKSLLLKCRHDQWPRHVADPDGLNVQASVLGALPGWLSRSFPALLSLDIRGLHLTVNQAVDEFHASMETSCSIAVIHHDIRRPICQSNI